MDIEALGVDPQAVALALAVKEIEKEASRNGWDHAPTVYALVPSKDLLEDPQLPEGYRDYLEPQLAANPAHLTAVIQEDLSSADVMETLGYLAWPEQVAGMAVTLERVSVPPEVEAQAPEDAEEAARFFAEHPDRDEVRICAGVLRTGQQWCALRARSHDDDDSVVESSDLIPDLTAALLATFEPEGPEA
ncbi:hypothetical protein BSR29_02465 [Boudabousia liubingyangii]|uniref:Uncharacterized protein n=1 Tax=Boudabousia liubingyangii TaxID=1921764 RepID=A0A1Q5PR62_9ACTO|nr:PPA1309 family protein [Boudabousia liubingyangii]OKL46108.1 hypothetical protein BSR28_08445 [Boudabousia liubingyangii]OKL49890.1 hypothetical protein BSR29_02465 [Boudabousia liubingyangii]